MLASACQSWRRVVGSMGNEVAALRMKGHVDGQGLPDESSWAEAEPVTFCSDWRAEHPDPLRETIVRLLWSPDFLFFRFHCRYREIFVYEGGPCRRDRLWLRDVAEVFIRRETGDPRQYKEFEISPNGDWLGLDIAPGRKSLLSCDLKSRVVVNSEQRVWTAEMAIPVLGFSPALNPEAVWRLNLFRIEGHEPDRFYSAWIPTFTDAPNFHVPEVFGRLTFRE